MNLLDHLLPYQRNFVLAPQRNKFFLCSRQGGKSHCGAYITAFEAIKKPKSKALVISTGARAALSWLDKAEKYAQAIQVLSNGDITYFKTSDRVKFSNGSQILSLPSGNPAALRGESAQCVLIDECFFIERPEDVLAAINPTLTRSPDSKLILCSTPGSKRNPFFDILQKAKTDKSWYVQTTTIHDAISDGLNVDLDSLHQLCPDPNIFAQEFECRFAENVNSLIDTALLEFTTSDDKFDEYFIGVDWARTSDGSAIAVIGRRRDGKMHLVELINMHNVEYAKQIAVATEIFRKYNPKLMYGDAGGLGNPLCEQLNRNVSARIKGFTFSGINKPKCYEYFRKSVFDRKLAFNAEYRNIILDDISLIEQIIGENGKISYVARRYNGSHADNVSAIILALQAEHDCRQQADTPSSYSLYSAFGGFSGSRL